VNRWLIWLGVLLVVAGLAWPWLRRLPLFHLPGDIVVDRPGFRLFLPFTTMLILSLVISLILWLMRK
jgi:Protein of unknown function (DUF2905)